jgi:hypothetical protein
MTRTRETTWSPGGPSGQEDSGLGNKVSARKEERIQERGGGDSQPDC